MKHLKINPKLALINTLLIVVVFWALFSLGKDTGKANQLTVQTEAVNIRTGPGLDYEVMGQVKKGETLELLKEDQKWYNVRLSNKKTGWVASWLLNEQEATKTTEESTPAAEPTTPGEFLYARLNETKIRTEPTLEGEIIATLQYGDKIAYQGAQGDWYQVKTASGDIGYVANWIVSFTSLNESKQRQVNSIAEATILLDPGHGGEDVGAQSNDGTIREKVVTLATANYVAEELRKLGAKVVFTRDDDTLVYLNDITKHSNELKPDAFISFHYDSTEVSNQATGFTTYYYANADSELAQAINQQLAQNLPLTNRGVETGDYLVIRENEYPAILLELGYMNNDSDVQTFKTKKFQRQVATSIADALVDYFGK